MSKSVTSKSSGHQTIVEMDCPKCGQSKGSPCRTPKGRKVNSPGGHWEEEKLTWTKLE